MPARPARPSAALTRGIVVLALGLARSATAAPAAVAAAPGAAEPAPGDQGATRLTVSAQAAGTTVSLRFPALGDGESLEEWAARQAAAPLPSGLVWTTLEHPGRPRLPALALLLGLPPAGEPCLEVVALGWRPLPGTRQVAPAPRLLPAAGGAGLLEQAAAPDAAVYGGAGWFPPRPAQLDAVARLRDRRLGRVLVHPFRWRPADGRLEQLGELTLRVATGAAVAVAAADAAHPAGAGPSAAPPTAVDAEDPLATRLVNGAQARAWRGWPAAPAATGQAAAPGPAWKLIVDQDGWYEVTGAELAAAGLSVAGEDPRRLRLRQGGREVALRLVGEADGRLDPQDRLGFWGERRRGEPGWVAFDRHRFPRVLGDARYGDDNSYLLDLGPEPGLRIQERDAAPVDDGVPRRGSLPFVLRQEPSKVYWAWHLTSDDVWFWDEFSLGEADVSRSYVVAVPDADPAGGPATVRAAVLPRMPLGSVAPVRARLSAGEPETALDDRSWQGIARQVLAGDLPGPPGPGAELKVTLTLPREGGSPGVRLHLDWIEVAYDRLLKAMGAELALTAPAAPSRLQVGGLGEGELLALDLGDPRRPVRLGGLALSRDAEGRQATFATAAGGGGYWLGSEAAFRRPKQIAALGGADLWRPEAGAEHLIISPAAFREGAERLAAHRRARGLSSRVVDLQAVFDQFGDGLAQPAAIRAFLAHALTAWPEPRPAYALLVGDGTWNLRGSPNYPAEPVFMPPNMVFADPYQGEVDSANQLAAVLGEDALPDLAIGRAPVGDAAEMEAFVAKTIAYELAGPRPQHGRHAFISDCAPDAAGDFIGEVERFIRDMLPPGATARRLRANDFPGACPPGQSDAGRAAANAAILELFNREGGLFFNYVGHGSANRWSSLPLLTTDHVPALANGERLPIVLSWTCLDGYWCFPGLPSLAEALLVVADRGSVAGFAPTGLGLVTGHDLLWRGFYRSVFATGTRRLGPAATDAKLALWAGGRHLDLIETYTVFGDPALRLPLADAPPITRTPVAPEPTATPGPSATAATRTTPDTTPDGGRFRVCLPLLSARP
jgi:hypothetical protein